MVMSTELFDRVLAAFHQWDVEVVVAGGAVADLVFGRTPRDVDVFAWDSDVACRVAQALGFRAVGTHVRPVGDYRQAVAAVRRVFKGQIDGVPVDLVLVSRGVVDQGRAMTLLDYVQTYFDLDVKMVVYDGRIRELELFRRVREAGVVDVVNWHTPIATAIRLWDAVERYGLRPGPTFGPLLAYFKAWQEKDQAQLLARLSDKYRARLPIFAAWLEGQEVGPDLEAVQLIDLAQALTSHHSYPVLASRLSAPMRYWLEGQLYLEGTTREEQEFARRVCALSLSATAPAPRPGAARLAWDIYQALVGFACALPAEVRRQLRLCGLWLEDLFCAASSAWDDAVSAGKFCLPVQAGGRVRPVRLGKLLLALANCAEKQGQNDSAADFRHLLHQWEQLGPASPTRGRLVVSQRVEDLLSITRGRVWNSCMDWGLGHFCTPALSLLANLDGRTAVAILQDEHGGWLARALLRLDAERGTLWYERVYGVSQELRNMLLALLLGAAAHEGRIKVRQLTPGATRLGPFLCPPYSDVLSVKAEDGYWWLE